MRAGAKRIELASDRGLSGRRRLDETSGTGDHKKKSGCMHARGGGGEEKKRVKNIRE